jgi:intracellular septation protein A
VDNKPVIETKKSYGTLIILIIGFIGTGLIAYYLINKSLSMRYYQIGGFIGGAIFGLFCLLSLISIFLIDNLKVFNDRLIIYSSLGFVKRTILFRDISKWTEIEKETKYTKWKDLIIYYADSQYKISSSAYKNYEKIKYNVTKGKRKDEIEIDKWLKRVSFRYSIFFILFGVLVLFGAYWLHNSRLDKKDKNFIRIAGILDNKPEIKKGSKGSRYVQIILREYPEFKFSISGVAYSQMYASDYTKYVNQGDTIFVTVDELVASKKLFRTSTLEYLDKHYGWDRISVYGVSDTKRNYLSLDDYIYKDKNEGSILFWIFIFVGFGFIIYGLYKLNKIKPVANTRYSVRQEVDDSTVKRSMN